MESGLIVVDQTFDWLQPPAGAKCFATVDHCIAPFVLEQRSFLVFSLYAIPNTSG